MLQSYTPNLTPVQAVQWFGQDFPGLLRHFPVVLVMSADLRHYYLTGFFEREHLADAWLPLKPGAHPELPFALWSVRSGPHVGWFEVSELRERYEAHMAECLGVSETTARPYARLVVDGQAHGLVRWGDYLVCEDGAWRVVAQRYFEGHYLPGGDA